MEGEKPKIKPKLTKTTIILMAITVGIYEVIKAALNFLVPVVGPFLSGVVADLHFFFWFSLKGVSFTKNPKRALGGFASLVFNGVEGADVLSLPAGVALTIFTVLAEEKLANNPLVGSVAKKAMGTAKVAKK